MVPRYSRPEMTAIWSADNRYRIWWQIEVFAAEAMGRIGMIPAEDAATIRAAYDANALGEIDIAAIDAIEAVTKHDVIAFLTWAGEKLGPERRWLHQGMTSSDVLDTALAVQLKQSADLLLADLDALLEVLKRRAFEHKLTPTIGRSHGIHAEPTTFGLKLAQAYAEFARNRERLRAARADVATCAISGAVGTFANVPPEVEAHVASELGLAVEPVSTQVIPRDRHALFFATLGVIASSIERLATEVRHLQRTEVLEAEEYFSPGQKGSSAMPHKRNPVLSENLTGLARMVRGYVTPALENVALWHERDISHSSVERFIGPDATITLDFALGRLAGLIDKLVVYPERMQKNLDRMGGLVHSQRVMLALTQAGLQPRGRLCIGPAQRDEGVGSRRRAVAARSAQGRSRRGAAPAARAARCAVRPRLSSAARRYDLRARVRLTEGRGVDGGIQSCGYLLELSLDWIVERASENVHHLLGESHVTLIDEPLGRFVQAQALHDLRNLFSRLSATTGIARAYRVRLTDHAQLYDIAFQQRDERVLVEAVPSPVEGIGEALSAVGGLADGLAGESGSKLLDAAARRMRALTAFDRVTLLVGEAKATSDRTGVPFRAGANATLGDDFPALVADAALAGVPVFPRDDDDFGGFDRAAARRFGRADRRAGRPRLCLDHARSGDARQRGDRRIPPRAHQAAAPELRGSRGRRAVCPAVRHATGDRPPQTGLTHR